MKRLKNKVREKTNEIFVNHQKKNGDIDWRSKPAQLQSGIQHFQDKPFLNRRHIIKCIMDVKKEEILYSKSQTINTDDYEVSKYAEEKKKILLKSLEEIEQFARLDDKEQLRYFLRAQLPQSICDQRVYDKPTYQFLKGLTIVKLQNEQLNENKSNDVITHRQGFVLQQMKKALDLRLRNKFLQIQTEVQKAMLSTERPKIDTESVVNRMSPNKLDQQRLMLYHYKPNQNSEQRFQTECVQNIQFYCQELAEGRDISKALQDSLQVATFASKKQKINEKYPKKGKNKILRSSSSNLFDGSDLLTNFQQQQDSFFSKTQVADRIIKKIEYSLVCKKASLQPTFHEPNADARVEFFRNFKEQIEPSVDILNKIINKTLQLKNYHLNLGQCSSFKHALQAESDIIHQIMINDCGVDDNMLCEIFQGLLEQKRVAQIYLKQTSIGEKSLPHLTNLISKMIPNNLEELRLENCPISIELMRVLLRSIQSTSYLQRLILNNMEISSENVKLITSCIKQARQLNNIDLAYNKFTFGQIMPILQVICQSKRFQYINLSWNSLVENNNFGVIGSPCNNEEELSLRKTNRKRKDPPQGISKKEKMLAAMLGEDTQKKSAKKKPFNENEKQVVDLIQQMLIQNPKLMHLDLSECGLSSDMLLEISKAMKYSQSLIAVHISGNPGLNKQTQNKIIQRLSATYEKSFKMNSFKQFIQRQQNQTDDLQEDVSNVNTKLLDGLFIKKIKQLKEIFLPCNSGQISDAQQRHFILTRKLGHKIDIPGGSEWQLFKESHDQCYVCDRKIYTVFLWSPVIGRLEMNSLGLNHQQKQSIINYIQMDRQISNQRIQTRQIDQKFYQKKNNFHFDKKIQKYVEDEVDTVSQHDTVNDEIDSEECVNSQNIFDTDDQNYQRDKKQALIYGQFNNWSPQPMIKLSHLIDYLNDSEPDFLHELKKKGLCRREVKNVIELDKAESLEYKQISENYRIKLLQYNSWQSFLKEIIVYRLPHFNQTEHLKEINANQIYFIADFTGCGKQDYMVQYGKEFFFHQTVANIRREEIIFPKLDGKALGRVERNPNVFKLWPKDTPELLEQCYKSDFEGWKLNKFVKDPLEQQQIQDIIKKNYLFLKEVYLSVSCRSNFPFMTNLDFGLLMEHCQIPDKPPAQGAPQKQQSATIGIIDTQFIAARTDADQRGMKLYNQNGNDINRFEFFEALIRVSGCKWKATGAVQNYAQALSLMIESIQKYYQPLPWQSFRENQLWTRDVNLTLDANKLGIMALYELYSRNKQKKMSFKEVQKLMTVDTNIKLSEKDAIVCYAMSLATCSQIVKTSFMNIDHMTLLEFMELIGRVADTHFNDLNKPLYEKVNYVLDEWLLLVEYQREEAQYFEDGVFEESEDEEQTTEQKEF